MTTRTNQQQHNLYQLLRVAEAAPDDLLHMNACVEEASCGTARCLFGWAIIDRYLRKHSEIGLIPIDFASLGLPVFSPAQYQDTFGITYQEARNLFASRISVNSKPHAISKRAVVTKIKRLLAGKAIGPYKGVRA